MSHRRLSYEMMRDFLVKNGWEALWHEDNWVKVEWLTDPNRNVDTSGYSTEAAYLKCKNEKLWGPR